MAFQGQAKSKFDANHLVKATHTSWYIILLILTHTAGIMAFKIVPVINNQSCYDNKLIMSQYAFFMAGQESRDFIQVKYNMSQSLYTPATIEHNRCEQSQHFSSTRQQQSRMFLN